MLHQVLVLVGVDLLPREEVKVVQQCIPDIREGVCAWEGMVVLVKSLLLVDPVDLSTTSLIVSTLNFKTVLQRDSFFILKNFHIY